MISINYLPLLPLLDGKCLWVDGGDSLCRLPSYISVCLFFPFFQSKTQTLDREKDNVDECASQEQLKAVINNT